MAKHLPATVWATYPADRYPYAYVTTASPSEVEIVFFAGNGDYAGTSFVLSRRHAKLLARRINQCLEETK